METDLVEPAREFLLPPLRRFGFYPEHAISGLSHAVLLSKPARRVCDYLILRERPGTLWATLWVGPPQFPDARLQHCPGYSIELGTYSSKWTLEEFLRRIAKRAEILVPRLAGVRDAVAEELSSPVFQSDFALQYVRGMFALERMKDTRKFAESKWTARVLDAAKSVAAGHKPADHLAAACVPLVKELLPLIEELQDPIFAGKARVIARQIAPHFYVDAAVTGP